jgi:hypothetical protein
VPQKTASEKRFERYLQSRNLDFQFEPDLGTHFQPDYKVSVGGAVTIVEVKEFKTTWLSDRLSSIGSVQASRPTAAVRKRVRRAARQLVELADEALPLVIVISNPLQADVDLDPERVWASLYFDGGPLEGNRADHVSAVVILHRRTAAQELATENVRRWGPMRALLAAARLDEEGTVPEEETLYVTVLPTLSAIAAPLPDELFNGPADSVWRPPAPLRGRNGG